MPNYYEVLGVSERAEDIVIDGAFRALMKRYHPDVAGQGGADLDARVKEITEAYGTLKDPVSRARYDRDLEYRARRSEGATANTPPDTAEDRSTSVSQTDFRNPGNALSNGFMGLAAIVILGAIGSLGNFGSAEPPQRAAATEVARTDPAQKTPEVSSRPGQSPANEPVTQDTEAAEPSTPVPLQGERPSFNCGRADTEVLRLICSNSDLAQADRHMAEAFAKAMERPDTRAEIRAAQRAWLRDRDASPADVDTLITLYSNRMVSLNEGPVQEPIY